MPIIDLTILNYVVAGVVIYYMALFAHLTVRRALRSKMRDTGYRPMFFILIPAHNEEEVIAHTIEALLHQDYEHTSIMVMNDGSKDNTSQIAHEYAERYSKVMVVDRGPEIAGKGKGAVLNHAFEIIREMISNEDPRLEGRGEENIIIAITDADGQLERHTLTQVSYYFAEENVGGVQIGVRIANASTNLLTRMQDVEFVGFSAFVQEARDAFGSVGLGGNGQFTRLSALISLGCAPWSDCLTEDLDLGLSLVRRGWRMRFCPNAYVAQQAVTSLRLLFRQRTRWVQGHYQCWRHLPLLLKDKSVNLVTRIDLALYLVLVVFVVLVSIGMVLNLLSTMGLIVVHFERVRVHPARPGPQRLRAVPVLRTAERLPAHLPGAHWLADAGALASGVRDHLRGVHVHMDGRDGMGVVPHVDRSRFVGQDGARQLGDCGLMRRTVDIHCATCARIFGEVPA